MHEVTITIPDELYSTAVQRAASEGFPSMEVYLSSLLASSVAPDGAHFDNLFTPAVIADLDAISSEIKVGGKTYTSQEVDEHFAAKQKAWLATHPS
ncbi:MAG TPA: hypothetical protein VGK19_12285 [Capsulimonadaceae bacterium]|jgi:phytoene dehydrogenase-like protein